MTTRQNNLDCVPLSSLREFFDSRDTGIPAYFDVTTSWKGGFQSESTCNPSIIKSSEELPANKIIHADEPAVLGGDGVAPNPQELMLAAFNACLTAAYVTAAAEAHVVLEKLQIQTYGIIDLQGFLNRTGDFHSGSESIRYVITVRGSGTQVQFERLHQTVIATSPNRWLIGGNMLIEGDQVVESA